MTPSLFSRCLCNSPLERQTLPTLSQPEFPSHRVRPLYSPPFVFTRLNPIIIRFSLSLVCARGAFITGPSRLDLSPGFQFRRAVYIAVEEQNKSIEKELREEEGGRLFCFTYARVRHGFDSETMRKMMRVLGTFLKVPFFKARTYPFHKRPLLFAPGVFVRIGHGRRSPRVIFRPILSLLREMSRGPTHFPNDRVIEMRRIGIYFLCIHSYSLWPGP